jgi:hypothetical protein
MKERGAAGTGMGAIVFIVLYIGVVGWMANTMAASGFGFSAPVLASLHGWSLPLANTNISVLNFFYDFFIVIVNIFAWIISALASFVVLIGYSVQGDIPIWLATIAFIPIGFGMVWAVLDLVRG